MCSPATLGPAMEADSLLNVGWRKNSASLALLVRSIFLESIEKENSDLLWIYVYLFFLLTSSLLALMSI